jgi:hypothetical protein
VDGDVLPADLSGLVEEGSVGLDVLHILQRQSFEAMVRGLKPCVIREGSLKGVDIRFCGGSLLSGKARKNNTSLEPDAKNKGLHLNITIVLHLKLGMS